MWQCSSSVGIQGQPWNGQNGAKMQVELFVQDVFLFARSDLFFGLHLCCLRCKGFGILEFL